MPGKVAIVRETVGSTAKIRDETTESVCLAQRSRIILLAFERRLNEEIADEVSSESKAGRTLAARLAGVVRCARQHRCSSPTTALRSGIEEVLSDAPRRGSPRTFTVQQQMKCAA